MCTFCRVQNCIRSAVRKQHKRGPAASALSIPRHECPPRGGLHFPQNMLSCCAVTTVLTALRRHTGGLEAPAWSRLFDTPPGAAYETLAKWRASDGSRTRTTVCQARAAQGPLMGRGDRALWPWSGGPDMDTVPLSHTCQPAPEHVQVLFGHPPSPRWASEGSVAFHRAQRQFLFCLRGWCSCRPRPCLCWPVVTSLRPDLNRCLCFHSLAPSSSGLCCLPAPQSRLLLWHFHWATLPPGL